MNDWEDPFKEYSEELMRNINKRGPGKYKNCIRPEPHFDINYDRIPHFKK